MGRGPSCREKRKDTGKAGQRTGKRKGGKKEADKGEREPRSGYLCLGMSQREAPDSGPNAYGLLGPDMGAGPIRGMGEQQGGHARIESSLCAVCVCVCVCVRPGSTPAVGSAAPAPAPAAQGQSSVSPWRPHRQPPATGTHEASSCSASARVSSRGSYSCSVGGWGQGSGGGGRNVEEGPSSGSSRVGSGRRNRLL